MNRIVLSGVAVACIVCLQESAQSQAGQTARGVRLEIQSGSKAEYRVREQLARLNFPNDAVGATESITGALVARTDGTFTGDSKLSVDSENTLETNRYPLAEFVPRRYTSRFGSSVRSVLILHFESCIADYLSGLNRLSGTNHISATKT